MSIEIEGPYKRDGSHQVWSAFRSRWAAARRMARVRREYQDLLEADERILKDVGLTRAQVEFERRRFNTARG